ncbi:MAG TPA: hypothetical protein PKU97_15860 [Kofleriaceae bacterium]|nr:hypothetical protein [Kofleriaceae bacterium]
MSKTEASSPDAAAPFDAQRTRLEEPMRFDDHERGGMAAGGPEGPTEPAPGPPEMSPVEPMGRGQRAPRELDDNWSLSASLAVPRVTGVTDAAPDPDAVRDDVRHQQGAPPDAPVVNQAAAPRQALSRAALRLLGGKTMQGVGPAPGQRRPAAGGAALGPVVKQQGPA